MMDRIPWRTFSAPAVLALVGLMSLTSISHGQEEAAKPRPEYIAKRTIETSNLPVKVRGVLRDQVLTAYYRGKPAQLIQSISGLLPLLNDIQRIEVADVLAAQGIPSLEDMLIDSRKSLVLQSGVGGVEAPGRYELIAVLPELKRRVREVREDAVGHSLLQPTLPSPAGFRDYERMFWRIHVLEQELSNAKSLADYGQSLQARTERFVRRASDEERAALETRFEDDQETLIALYNELAQRKIELRVQRLELANHKLLTSESRRERFDAAYVAVTDGELLEQFFKHREPKETAREDAEPDSDNRLDLTRPFLLDDDLAQNVRELTASARQSAGDLAEKSYLFYTGVHWWLRGRYGRGVEGAGLLKSRNAARAPNGLFQLYMPAELYDTERQDQGRLIQAPINRRHHYVWAFEPRRLVTQNSSDEFTLQNDRATSKTTLKYFY